MTPTAAEALAALGDIEHMSSGGLDYSDALRLVRAFIDGAGADSARLAWLSDRFVGADFEYGEPARPVLLVKFDGVTVWGDLTLTVDEAMKHGTNVVEAIRADRSTTPARDG